MAELKLRRLPDRVAVKLTVTVEPDLHNALQAYADLYRETYGEAETVQTLIPYMLRDFLEGDRGFAKVSKQRAASRPAPAVPSRPRRSQQTNHGEGQPDQP